MPWPAAMVAAAERRVAAAASADEGRGAAERREGGQPRDAVVRAASGRRDSRRRRRATDMPAFHEHHDVAAVAPQRGHRAEQPVVRPLEPGHVGRLPRTRARACRGTGSRGNEKCGIRRPGACRIGVGQRAVVSTRPFPRIPDVVPRHGEHRVASRAAPRMPRGRRLAGHEEAPAPPTRPPGDEGSPCPNDEIERRRPDTAASRRRRRSGAPGPKRRWPRPDGGQRRHSRARCRIRAPRRRSWPEAP